MNIQTYTFFVKCWQMFSYLPALETQKSVVCLLLLSMSICESGYQ